ncbi:uncharacterized protein LOC118735190 [Rhagoletis pomonella]|uniref:uncharacterized protein LOC118735190 n=1 Tax=Rhagoletis pomonella TaxID=28610 RepID=UPI00177E47F1|nr:uncharacterized protein LOC118735190 [Rhagoletis pomonella]
MQGAVNGNAAVEIIDAIDNAATAVDDSAATDAAAVTDEAGAAAASSAAAAIIRNSADSEDVAANRPAAILNRRAVTSHINTNAPNIISELNESSTTALDEEIKKLRQQKEILELKRQIRELENVSASGPAHVPGRRVNFSDIEYAVPKFSGDEVAHSVTDFLREFSEVMASINADEQFLFLSLRRSLTGTARQFLKTANVFTFEALREALINEFGTVVSRRDVYRMLARRYWKKEEESLHCYILVMQSIAKRSDIGELEVIDFIIEGIGNKVNNINLLVGARSVKELKKLVNRYQQKYLTQNAAADLRKTKQSLAVADNAAKTTTDTSADNPLCYNCSQRGHIKPNCPHPLRVRGSCFRCWQMGHSHRECNNPKKNLKAVPGKQVAAVEEDPRVLDSLNLSG